MVMNNQLSRLIEAVSSPLVIEFGVLSVAAYTMGATEYVPPISPKTTWEVFGYEWIDPGVACVFCGMWATVAFLSQYHSDQYPKISAWFLLVTAGLLSVAAFQFAQQGSYSGLALFGAGVRYCVKEASDLAK